MGWAKMVSLVFMFGFQFRWLVWNNVETVKMLQKRYIFSIFLFARLHVSGASKPTSMCFHLKAAAWRKKRRWQLSNSSWDTGWTRPPTSATDRNGISLNSDVLAAILRRNKAHVVVRVGHLALKWATQSSNAMVNKRLQYSSKPPTDGAELWRGT